MYSVERELHDMTDPTPTTIEGFTPAWLTRILRGNSTITSETTVTGVDHKVLGEGEGFMGIVARLSLSYEGPEGPATMIAKVPTTVPENRAMGKAISVYEREVRIYADILPALDIPSPRVYAAVYEAVGDEHKQQETMEKVDRLPMFLIKPLTKLGQKKGLKDSYVPPCVILIEDLSGSGEIGNQVEDASVEKLGAGLAALAKLHAQTWDADRNPSVQWEQGPQSIPKVIHALFLNGHNDFVQTAGSNFSAHTVALLKACKKTGVARVKRFYADAPWCLSHGDFRLDNMFFGPDGPVTAIIDWQNATPGPGMIDVAYFLASSMHEESPESDVDRLLAGYHDELLAHGVSGYSLEQVKSEYLDALLIVVERLQGLTDAAMIDLGDGRGVDLMKTWLRRFDARLQRVPLEHAAN